MNVRLIAASVILASLALVIVFLVPFLYTPLPGVCGIPCETPNYVSPGYHFVGVGAVYTANNSFPRAWTYTFCWHECLEPMFPGVDQFSNSGWNIIRTFG